MLLDLAAMLFLKLQKCYEDSETPLTHQLSDELMRQFKYFAELSL